MSKISKSDRIAVIAGEDSLPQQIYKKCMDDGVPCFVICVKGNSNSKLYKKEDSTILPIVSISKILNALKAFGATKVILAGKVRRVKLSKLLLDIKGIKLFAKIMRSGVSDDALLSAIVDFVENEGFKVIPADSIVNDIFASKGSITKNKPTSQELDDINRGKKILHDISKHDMGQALVIQSGLVLGVEAAEGTDELITRCGSIQQKIDERPVLIKRMKVDQSDRIDTPCIGTRTISNLSEANFSGVAIEANKTYILDKKETIALADKLKIFIYGF